MFSSRALVPARRATLAALQTNVADFQPLIFLHQTQSQSQRRSIVRSRFPRKLVRQDRNSEGRLELLFKPSDIPPVDLWREFQSKQELGGLTAEDALRTAIQYCDVATSNGSAWKGALEKDFNIDPYTLHYTAIPLVQRGQGNAGNMGRHMLLTASSLRYTPSTLSLMCILARVRDELYSKTRTVFRDAESHFKRLLQTENDPDIFTVQGLLLLREAPTGTYALKYFDKAIEAARSLPPPNTPNQTASGNPTPRKPRWFYEPYCHHRRGLILLQKNRIEEALASFKIAALELDLAPSCLELAKLLPRDAPERETYLLKAAQAGEFEACRLYALHWADKAADSSLPREDRVYATSMAREWAGIEPDADKRREVESLVAERTRGF